MGCSVHAGAIEVYCATHGNRAAGHLLPIKFYKTEVATPPHADSGSPNIMEFPPTVYPHQPEEEPEFLSLPDADQSEEECENDFPPLLDVTKLDANGDDANLAPWPSLDPGQVVEDGAFLPCQEFPKPVTANQWVDMFARPRYPGEPWKDSLAAALASGDDRQLEGVLRQPHPVYELDGQLMTLLWRQASENTVDLLLADLQLRYRVQELWVNQPHPGNRTWRGLLTKGMDHPGFDLNRAGFKDWELLGLMVAQQHPGVTEASLAHPRFRLTDSVRHRLMPSMMMYGSLGPLAGVRRQWNRDYYALMVLFSDGHLRPAPGIDWGPPVPPKDQERRSVRYLRMGARLPIELQQHLAWVTTTRNVRPCSKTLIYNRQQRAIALDWSFLFMLSDYFGPRPTMPAQFNQRPAPLAPGDSAIEWHPDEERLPGRLP